LSAGGVVVVEAPSGGIKVSPFIPHGGGASRGVVGELEPECAHGSGGSMGLRFLGGWCGGGADPFVDFVLGFRRRGRDSSIVATELLRFCTGSWAGLPPAHSRSWLLRRGCGGSGRATSLFSIDSVDWLRRRGDSDKLGAFPGR
jgi:hypothetical protein